MTPQDAEKLGLEVRKMAGLRPDEVVLAARIAQRLGIGLTRLPELESGAFLAPEGDGFRVFLRAHLPDSNWAVIHEVGHAVLRLVAKYRGPDEEALASRVGSALLVSPSTMRAAYHWFGEDKYDQIAPEFAVSRTFVALRLDEIGIAERAVVTRSNNVITTLGSQIEIEWPRPIIVSAVESRGLIKGLAKTRLRGGIDEGRTAVRVVSARAQITGKRSR